MLSTAAHTYTHTRSSTTEGGKCFQQLHTYAHTCSTHNVSSVNSTVIEITTLNHLQHHPLKCPLSRTTWVSWYRKVKPVNVDLLKQETVSGSDISWTVCKSAPHFRQVTMPASQHSAFYRPDALPASEPTASKQ